ncbi:transcriptional regulator [Vibrio ostreicida]|uniref:Winged helix-turn-helix domain-containing protein n=1 Tax=Vibrio ostreicida TaxID=526588 RepID=A0ABT8BPG0_9VIBR|nr:winged helix-turn-helix domain-containing protein [Vibrio ostreicida]MDN3608682.1 winged helix-turn-helix domain-containing protein [Vibrio ostreicida]NPD10634.1 transcriptional regulator [Vibrio ostreicida]
MITFDPVVNRLSGEKRDLKIGYREVRVLEILITSSPDVVKKHDIIQYAWGNEYIGDTSLAKSISLLRQAITKLGSKESPIITVPKIGYRLASNCILLSRPDQVSADHPPQTATSGGPIKQVTHLPKDYKNHLCYVLSITLLFAASILGLSKMHGWRWEDIPHDQLLSEQTIGQLQVITSPNTQLSLPLRQLLSTHQCDCVVYIENNSNFGELAWLDKKRQQSINVFYTSGQLSKASQEIERFMEKGQP